MRILLAVLFTVLLSAGAAAQSCSALRAELSSAQSGRPDMAAVGRLERQYRAYGCNRSGGFGRHGSCGRIEAQLRSARQGTDPRRVRQLQARVARACAQQQPVQQAPTRQVMRRGAGDRVTVVNVEPGRNIFSAIFGRRDERVERHDADRVAAIPTREVERATGSGGTSAARPTSSNGMYRIPNARTVCVRLCDGFYFPINSQSHYSNFRDELAMCVGRCPGADVSLYAHDRSAPVESMRSAVTGERYVSLPTAFVYRKQRVPNCGCEPQTIAKTETADEALAFVEDADGEGETPSADGAAVERLTAVFDETGKPLHETLAELRRRRATPSSTAADAQDLPDVAEQAEAAPEVEAAPEAEATPEAGGQPVAASSVSVEVREVGPQFFSAPGEAEDAGAGRRLARPFMGSTAVSVVPVASSAVVVERISPAADEDAGRSVEAPAEVRPDGARTSSLPGTPAGG